MFTLVQDIEKGVKLNLSLLRTRFPRRRGWAFGLENKIRFMKTFLLHILLVLVSAQIVHSDEHPQGATSNPVLEQFIRFGSNLHKHPIGKFQKEDIEKVQNQHNKNQTDEWHTAYYDGITVTFYRAGSAQSDLLSKVVFFARKSEMPFGIKIGDRKVKILERLGKPTENRGEDLYFKLPNESYEESVSFRFSKGRLTQVQWNFEID